MTISNYELIDFGEGRKLERFGEVVFDRPAPAAEHARKGDAEQWQTADVVFEKTSETEGVWNSKTELPESWTLDFGKFRMLLQPTPFGHLGLFPEQVPNWDWIGRQVAKSKSTTRVLNLFAYTGGATLAAASAGAEVVHIDSAKNVVAWAKRNAELSGLQNAPVRWITEDATRFVEREIKRGNRYQGLILDPPSYGHGPSGQVWKIQKHLLPLLKNCRQILTDDFRFIVLTCHSPGFGPAELQASLADAIFGDCRSGAIASELFLSTRAGRKLPAGTVARWAAA